MKKTAHFSVSGPLPPRTARTARAIAIGVAAALILVAASSLAIVTAVAPGIVEQYAGIVVTPSGGVRIVGRQMSPRAVGDRTIFTLAADDGPTSGSALPTGYPMPAGASVVRSALYRDAHDTYRSTVVSVPMGSIEASDWYRTALTAAGWTVAGSADPTGAAPVVARMGGLATRVDFAGGIGPGGSTGLVAPLGSPGASLVGVLVTGP